LDEYDEERFSQPFLSIVHPSDHFPRQAVFIKEAAMRKRLIVRTVALVVCLVFIGLSASGLFAADKRSSKIDGRLLLRKPVQFLVSILPIFDSFFGIHRKVVVSSNDSGSMGTVKPTGELVSGRPSTGD
jgi:hypothetical protein